MRYLITLTLLISTIFYVNGQTLKGKVYDSKSVVKNIKVRNTTQNRFTVTDKNGDFEIIAKISDTLSFESLFYEPLTVEVKQFHLDDISVFEIKKLVSQLDEVEIKAEPEQPVFEAETFNQEFKDMIKEDIKKNPHLYMPKDSYGGGVNLLAVIDLVAKLFKSKKPKVPVYHPLTYDQLDSLFTKSSFFNKRLVKEDLKIPENKTNLFFDFCSAKGISSALLKEDKQMELLEEFVINSELFLMLIEQYGKAKATEQEELGEETSKD
ncbi:MAG: hypothetical protein HRU50_04465 [Winogradskyella sp.]|uniref:hypothetical protein n=1 Tax=Winogradskyella sp. TaxID=1883156 RepID=UPI0025F4AC3A|nr:hypothetical protein [Winogradskyella sp.]NRB59178.1 hypothetical protein [Winogradskyella sp.]